jgi:hypothetical protein
MYNRSKNLFVLLGLAVCRTLCFEYQGEFHPKWVPAEECQEQSFYGYNGQDIKHNKKMYL